MVRRLRLKTPDMLSSTQQTVHLSSVQQLLVQAVNQSIKRCLALFGGSWPCDSLQLGSTLLLMLFRMPR